MLLLVSLRRDRFDATRDIFVSGIKDQDIEKRSITEDDEIFVDIIQIGLKA